MDKRLFLLGLGAFVVSTVAFVFAGLLPLIAADTGATIAQAGYLVSVYSLAYAVGAPVLAAATGAMDRRHVIALALVFFAAGNLAAGLSGSFAPLLAVQIAMGAAAGLFAATAQAAAVSLAGPDQRAAAISVVVGGTTFAVALGAPAGSALAHLFGWRGTFLTLGAVALACLAALWILLPRGLYAAPSTLVERLAVVRRPGVLRAVLVTFLYMAGGFTIIGYLGPLATEGGGLAPEMVPVMLLAFGVGAIAGNYTSGRLADRLGARRVVIGSMLAAMLSAVTVSAVAAFVPDTIAGPLLFALMVVWGFVGWAFAPAQASRLVGFAPDAAHLSLALNASAIYLGIACGAVIGGRVMEIAGVEALGVVGSVLPLAALALVLAEQRGPRFAATRA